ncbi:hypothetical protein STEG23_002938, partial [Scotinomys teguina]
CSQSFSPLCSELPVRMLFSGGQCGHVGRPKALFLVYKIFLVILCFRVILVTSLKENAGNSSLLSPSDAASEVLSTLNKTGVKSQRNICNLSSICNDSVFFRGEIVFQYDDDHNVTQNQDTANGTLAGVRSLSELKRSELNKTLQTLSETYFIVCATAETQNTLNCTFTIKLNKTANVCTMMATFTTVQIWPMEQCCCSLRTPCPSSPEELEKLQCELQDPIVCVAYQPHGPLLPSSSKPVPGGPQATIFSHVTSDFSLPEPLDHASMTPSTPSLVQESHLPSPHPAAPLASSPATDMSVQAVAASSSLPQTHLSHTLLPLPSSLLPLTTPAPSVHEKVVTISLPPGETEVVNTSSVPDLEAQVSQMEKVLSLGGLEPNLAGEMVNRVSKLLHSPPALLAPLAQ